MFSLDFSFHHYYISGKPKSTTAAIASAAPASAVAFSATYSTAAEAAGMFHYCMLTELTVCVFSVI